MGNSEGGERIMPKLMSIEDFRKLQQESRRGIRVRMKTETRIIVGMGTCGIAAGARETMQAVLAELEKRGIDAHVTTVGCIGMCAHEPLVDIEQAEGARITYGAVRPEMVPRLIEEHLVNGRVVGEWVVGRMAKDPN
jgi:NADP-reducing hydrogenase subunit HndB